MLLQVGPERCGDVLLEPAHGLVQLGRAARAGNARCHGAVGHRKLQRSRWQGHAVRGARLVQRLGTRQHVRRRIRIVELAVAHQQPGVERAADDDGAAEPLARVHERQALLLQQRVAPGEQGAVQPRLLQAVEDDLGFVDAQAEAGDAAIGPELFERAEAALRREGLPVPGVPVAMGVGADVVHEQQVDALQAEPLQAVLERAHDAAVAVVVVRAERQRGGPAVVHRLHGGIGAHQPADLGADDEGIAGLLAQEGAHAVLAQRVPVERGGVEIAQAGIPCRLQRSPGVCLGRGLVQPGQRAATHAEAREPCGAFADTACFCDLHGSVRWVCGAGAHPTSAAPPGARQ